MFIKLISTENGLLKQEIETVWFSAKFEIKYLETNYNQFNFLSFNK